MPAPKYSLHPPHARRICLPKIPQESLSYLGGPAMFTRSRPCLIPRGSDLSPLHRLAALAIVLAAASPVLAQGTSCTPVVPCADTRGCPDLVIDGGLLWNGGDFVDGLGMAIQSRKFTQSDCAVQEGSVQAGTRKLLIFSTMTPNIGDGDVFLANYQLHPEWFDVGNCHGHAHLKDYADYRLWTETGYAMWTTLRASNPTACAQQILAAHPELLPHLIVGAKRGFCIIDVAEAGSYPNNPGSVPCPIPPADPPKYNSCLYQGLSH